MKTYYKNGDSAIATYRALKWVYGLHNRPIMQAIGKFLKKFEETGVVVNIERPVYHRFARSAFVSESVAENPNVLISRRSRKFGLSYGILWRTLHLHLHLHPHKVQLMQQLKPANHSQFRRCVEWLLEHQTTVGGNFSNKIFFSGKACFTLGGYVNKQNRCIWRSENPQIIEERPLHPERKKSHCLVRFLVRKCNWTLLLRNGLSPSIRSVMVM